MLARGTMTVATRLDTDAAARATARLHDGLPPTIDAVADGSPASHRFLRRRWYAAAVAAYGGAPRTIVASLHDIPALALPLVAMGPGWLKAMAVPGCYWPFRGAPAIPALCTPAVLDATLNTLARTARVVRIGPVYDGDPVIAPLIAAARSHGWGVASRTVATSYLLDMAALRGEGQWPRGSTLRKNRFHEKHLAAHGTLDWSFADPAGWSAAFDAMAEVEKRSWLAERTDGRDTKFTRWGHGAFFRAAAQDPVIAGMFSAALLHVDGVPAAFSFDLDAGTLKYAIANSYDPAYAKHSPGKLLYYRNLTAAIDRGVERVDWGAGDSGYKRVIGAAEGPAIRDWVLMRPGVPAWLAPLARRWWRTRD